MQKSRTGKGVIAYVMIKELQEAVSWMSMGGGSRLPLFYPPITDGLRFTAIS
jgi:hypothetical protein